MGILRKIKKIIISKDPRSGSIDELGASEVYHRLSDEDDSFETLQIEQQVSHHCGCIAPAGGKCAEPGCGVISCIRCHRHCGGTENPAPEGCGSPLCRLHSHYLQMPNGRTIPFCKHCYGKIARKAKWLTTAQALLQPFIEIEENENGRKKNTN